MLLGQSSVPKNLLVMLDFTSLSMWPQFVIYLQQLLTSVQPPIGHGGSTCRVVFQHQYGTLTLLDSPSIPFITPQILISILSSLVINGNFLSYSSTFESLSYANEYIQELNTQSTVLTNISAGMLTNISSGNVTLNTSLEYIEYEQSVNETISKPILVLFNGNSDINETDVMLAEDLKQNGTVIYTVGTSTTTQLESFKGLASPPATSFAFLSGESGGDITQLAKLMKVDVAGGE